MQKRGSFWKPFRSERINESQKLLKSGKKDFYPNLSSFWTKLSYEKLFLLRSEIPGLLVNTLTTNLKDCHSNRETLRLPIQIKLSKKPEIFFDFFFFFWLLFAFSATAIYLQRSEKNMSLVGQVFAKLLTPNFVFI